MENLEKRKKTNKIILIVFACIAIPLLFAIVLTPSDTVDVVEQPEQIAWNDATYEQKSQWINSYLKSPDDEGYALIDRIDTKLKSQFNNPNSVDYDFNDRPTFVKAMVTDADRGLVVINGSGTAKNEFGTELPFSYNVQLEIVPDQKKIIDIKVSN